MGGDEDQGLVSSDELSYSRHSPLDIFEHDETKIAAPLALPSLLARAQ